MSSLLAIMLFAGFSFSQEKKVEKSFDGVKSIDLSTASGDCEIVKGSGSSVKVLVIYTYDDDDYEPKMNLRGSNLNLEEKFHSGNTRGSSNWKLTVPDGLNIKFNSGSGDLILTNLKGDIDYNSGSGDAEVSDFDGELSLNSGSGDFRFENVKGKLKANSGSGDHQISNSSLSAKANTGSGDVRVDDSKGGYKLNTGSGDVEAKALTLSERGNFNTGSGDSEVELNAPLVEDISVNSGSGDALLDFNGNKIEGKIVMTCKKRGGDIKAPFKFDKEEEYKESGQTYLKKSVTFGSKNIEIKVGTGTGTAEIRE